MSDYNFEDAKAAIKELRNDLAVVVCDLKDELSTWDADNIAESDEKEAIRVAEIMRSDCASFIGYLEKIERI